MRDTLARRLFTKVHIDAASGCWNFQPARSGYGSINTRTPTGWRRQPTHRVSFELFNGSIPPGRVLHHVCENPPCCNPEHLMAVTPGEHMTDLTPGTIAFINSRKTHCPKGHPLASGNLLPCGVRIGRRLCRTCTNERHVRERAEKRATHGC